MDATDNKMVSLFHVTSNDEIVVFRIYEDPIGNVSNKIHFSSTNPRSRLNLIKASYVSTYKSVENTQTRAISQHGRIRLAK